MAMKKFDLEKNKALEVGHSMKQAGVPARFGEAASKVVNRRELRKADQALGLVPFACKLNSDLVKQLDQAAKERNIPVNTLLAEFILAGLSK